jgi:hypothetical protein
MCDKEGHDHWITVGIHHIPPGHIQLRAAAAGWMVEAVRRLSSPSVPLTVNTCQETDFQSPSIVLAY